MGNCLVTKLKESVNNNSLQRFGYLRLAPFAANSYINLYNKSESTSIPITVYGDVVVKDVTSGINYQNETFTFSIPNNPIYPNKLNFISGTVDGGYVEFPILESTHLVNTNSVYLKVMMSLDVLVSYNPKLAIGFLDDANIQFTGNPKFSTFVGAINADKTNLVPLVKRINLYNSNIEPDDQSIESLGIFTSATTIVLIRNEQDTWECDVDTLAAAQVANHRTSGTLLLNGRTGGPKTIKFGSQYSNGYVIE